MRRSAWTFGLAAVLLGGCPGDLENPECFPDQSAPRCTIPDFDPEAYFAETCNGSTCHGADHVADETNAVDLETPGAFMRLGTQSASATACADIPIIDNGNWQNSFLIRKLRGQQGNSCGERMPYASTLPEPELQCIGRWLVLGGTDLDVEMTGCVDRSGIDSGPRMDAGPMDGAVVDTSVEDAGPTPDAMTPDAGDDAGPAGLCDPITAGGFMLCDDTAPGCQAKTENLVSCDTICALAGLVCTMVVDDIDAECAPNLAGASYTCDQQVDNMHNYCFCGPA